MAAGENDSASVKLPQFGAGKEAIPGITLPKGGGAVSGLGEQFAVRSWTGTSSTSVPLGVTPGRSGLTPPLTLSYDSGAGNGPFGLGWRLDLPSVTRKTQRSIPRYREEPSDVFQLSGAEDLVPCPEQESRTEGDYVVRRYRPRVEKAWSRIEKWEHRSNGQCHWRVVSRDNVVSVFGATAEGRVCDPANPAHVFQWLLEETADNKGNLIRYAYKREDGSNIDRSQSQESHRNTYASRYLKSIDYGNRRPFEKEEWHFTVVLDYGEHAEDQPTPEEIRPWACRRDPFSNCRAGFEIRSYRLCRRVLMFHRFEELGEAPCLIRSDDFSYEEGEALTLLTGIARKGYIRLSDGYEKQAMPALSFAYTKPGSDLSVRTLEDEAIRNLPIGLLGDRVRWMDLFGEGVSGIVTEQEDAWYYKRNLGGGRLGGLQTVPSKPAQVRMAGGEWRMADPDGKGETCAVRYDGELPGYYVLEDGGQWSSHKPFQSLPNVDWNDPRLRFIDVTGDGRPDLLMTEQDAFTLYYSLGTEGFEAGERLPAWDDEEGPIQLLSDSEQSVHLADMSGDGLADLVRIRNGEVCYWPNLGYGRFGAKITMARPPLFDHPELLDSRRLRLFDLDGSGPADLVYMGRNEVTYWRNQSGNGWSEPCVLASLRYSAIGKSIDVVDLLGNGTACLVWSSSLPEDEGRPLQYVDLMGGVKPHLLSSMINNRGGEVYIRYEPSTRYYLKHMAEGEPWATKLPFPVHVVDRVETVDRISRSRMVTRYEYRHGYYDREEREFRGFGRVDQRDAESGMALAAGEETILLPPALTKTWYRTGASFEQPELVREYLKEYWHAAGTDGAGFSEPLTEGAKLALDGTAAAAERREACRALQGSILRQEVYAEDGSEKSGLPYAVTESNSRARVLQPSGNGRSAVFQVLDMESATYHYERNTADPRVTHRMVLETDEWGHVVQSAEIGYGRRWADPMLSPEDVRKQTKTYVVLTENRYTNAIDDPACWRMPLLFETSSRELIGAVPARGGRFELEELRGMAQAAEEIPYVRDPDNGLQKRLLSASRVLFRRDDLTGPLDAGVIEALALPFESYELAYTPGLLEEVGGTLPDVGNFPEEGGYVQLRNDSRWWIPGGKTLISEAARSKFYLPDGYEDSAGNKYVVEYDDYGLLVVRTVDPLGNTMDCSNDYRCMQPSQLREPNGNRASVCFNALGLVTGTATLGKRGESVGDSLEGFMPDLNEEERTKLQELSLDDARRWLGAATSRTIYDLEAYARTSESDRPQPVAVYSISRSTHEAELPAGQLAKVAMQVAYLDGLGRQAQTRSLARAAGSDGEAGVLRWNVSGWTVYNNKGKPFKTYEPFFSETHRFEERHEGVCTLMLYDPIGRAVITLRPNRTYEKVVIDPWRNMMWDVNDTLHPTFRYDPRHPQQLPDPSFNPIDDPDAGEYFRGLPVSAYWPTWYNERMDEESALLRWPDLDPITGRRIERHRRVRAEQQSCARKAAKHAATPTAAYLDARGSVFLTVADNGRDAEGNDRPHAAWNDVDALGRSVRVKDAAGRIVRTVKYDLAGRIVSDEGMDDGLRIALPYADGKVLYAYNGRGFRYRHAYDSLRRLLARYVRQHGGEEKLVERTVYGEAHPDSRSSYPDEPGKGRLNLRGKVWLQFDSAGMIEHIAPGPAGEDVAYDFKGNELALARRLARNYKSDPDWRTVEPILLELEDGNDRRERLLDALSPLLEEEKHTTWIQFDARNRPIRIKKPDGSVASPAYDDLGQLKRLSLRLRGENSPETIFVDRLEYDAKGQRMQIVYGNGTRTFYAYESETFRLSRVVTKRASEALQRLEYGYDPVGNVAVVHDGANQALFYNNQVVSADNEYEYDALYRLSEARGREHIGSGQRGWTDEDDSPRMNQPQPSDGAAMRSYQQLYAYDKAGNLTLLQHRAGTGGTWHRAFRYEEQSLIEEERYSNRLSGTTVGGLEEVYGYDPHGNMTVLPHLASLAWNHGDKLREADLGGGGTVYYVYDFSGRRVRKVIERLNGTRQKERLYLSGYEIYREYGGDGRSLALERETLHVMDNERRIASVDIRTTGEDGSPERLIRYEAGSRLESSALELDEQGNVMVYEEYYPFGGTSYQATSSRVEAPRRRFRYSLKERDEETGLYDYGARCYAPWLARWLSCDPAGYADGPNKYAYVRNNPITFKDKTGMWGEAGHYYTVYYVSLAAGFDEKTAYRNAFYAQMPDEVEELDAKHLLIQSELTKIVTLSNLPAASFHLYESVKQGVSQAFIDTFNGIQSAYGQSAVTAAPPLTSYQRMEKQLNDVHNGIHVLTAGRALAERTYRADNLQKLEPGTPEFGINLHAFGDSYAHTQMDNANRLYHPGWGHARHTTTPDEIEHRQGTYLQYVAQLYRNLADIAKRQGLPSLLPENEVLLIAREVSLQKDSNAQIALIRKMTAGMMGVTMSARQPEKEGLFSMEQYGERYPHEIEDPDKLLQESRNQANLYYWQGSHGK
ncbi:SpvB/TcaC N-terminal domain-containing protein [Cohnella boryungensis]|uniref:SpvB/TcaC N-terminal domain-containing protein n=1 Tax=Cohnella boryungensis TaxID=768479 RepID=A0ABV8SJ52_9BACL